MSDKLTLTPQQVRFLRERYTRILAQLVPIAHQYYESLSSPQLFQAQATVQIYTDAMLNLFVVFLDEGRYSPDEAETRQLTRLLLALSQYLTQRGLWSQSLRWATALLNHAETNGWAYDPALLAHLSRAHLEASDSQTTLRFIERALQSLLAVENLKVEGLLYVALSNVLFTMGQYDASIKWAIKATELPLQPPEPGLLADAWINACNALTALGHYPEALQAALTAHQNALLLGEADRMRLASTSSVLALAHTANGQYTEARPLYEASISFYDVIGDEPNAAHARFMYAVQCYRTGELGQARELAQASLSVYERYQIVASIGNAQALLKRLDQQL